MSITEDTTTSSESASYKWVGSRPIRPDGYDKVTGKARYGADLALPGMLEAAVLRSSHAHARIVAIDTSAAEAMPGVGAVITSADFPDLSEIKGAANQHIATNIIARGTALYEGHVIAAVAAKTKAQARAAVAAITVEYEVLDHVLTVDEAMADGAPVLHDGMITRGVDPAPTEPSNVAQRNVLERGELDKGLAEADVIVEREFTTKPVHQGYIEPHAVVADAGRTAAAGQRADLWVSSQGHFAMRTYTAMVLGWDPMALKVTPAEIGGGFGGKTVIYLEPLATALSVKSGKPVRLVMSRDEVFRASGPTSGSRMRVRMGVTNEGKITAAEVRMWFEAGAFPGSPVGAAGMTVLAPYDLEHFVIEGFDVVVNKPKVAAYRAPGAPISSFAVESVVDELADKIGIDPIELRLRNAVTEGSQAAYGPKFKRIGLVETLEAIRDHPHYTAKLGPNQGRGVATGFWFNAGLTSSASVLLNEDGTLTVITGSPDIGGSRASMALMAAEELGIDYDRIRPIITDTDTVGFNDVTGGSRVTLATGYAVVESCRQIKAELITRAAKTWDVEPDAVEWVDGRAQRTDGSGEGPLSIEELAGNVARTGGPISGSFAHNARGVGPAFSTQVCDVEVDPDTGVVRVLRYTTAQDAGTAIHPSYVEGQLQGGVVQGIGWALNEEYVHNADGVMENSSFLDYRIPVASDLPMIDTIVVEVPNPDHPYGVRGVGEVGIVPPLAAVANAVSRATGIRFQDLPLSPVRVLDGILDPPQP